MTKDLNTIIHAAQRGDESAFRLLIEQHYGYVHRLAYRILLDHDDAQDAAQETFVKVWQGLAHFTTSMNFTTWLYRIVSNTAIDRYRSRRRNAGVSLSQAKDIPDGGSASSAVLSNEIDEIIRDLLGHLPPLQRLVLALRDVEDLSIDDVASITGTSAQSVRTNLSYARKKMRELLATEYDIQGIRP